MSYNENNDSQFTLPSSLHERFYTVNEIFFRYMYLDSLKKEQCSEELYYKGNLDKKNADYENLTVIIPFDDTKNEKLYSNVYVILKYMKSLGIQNIIIPELKVNSKIGWIENEYQSRFDNIKFILNDTDEDINRATAINNAIKESSTEFIFIGDFNSLVSVNVFDESLSLLNTFYDFVYPNERIVKNIHDIKSIDSKYSFNNIQTDVQNFLDFEHNLLFCRKKSILNIGGYNPQFSNDYPQNNELSMRINLSDYMVARTGDIIYYLGDLEIINDDENELLKDKYNLCRFNDINLLINQSKELYMNSLIYKEEYKLKYTPDNYKLSVVIPIYNCEFYYLDRSISSLQNQTIGFENIEVIIVDDASIYEESKDLIKKYVKKYDNIKAVFLEVNSRSGYARGVGIQHATADYVTFLDHDDYYVKDICEKICNKIEEQHSDIIIANFINLTINRKYLMDYRYLKLKNGEEHLDTFKDDINVFKISPAMGIKTFRREFISENNLKFKGYTAGEDNLFNVEAILKAKGIDIMNIPAMVYAYRENENEELRSISLIISKDILIERIKAYNEFTNLFDKYAPEYAASKLNDTLIYWTETHFIKSNLNYDEFFEVVTEAQALFSRLIYDYKVKIQNRFVDLYNYIADNEPENAYNSYIQLIESTKNEHEM